MRAAFQPQTAQSTRGCSLPTMTAASLPGQKTKSHRHTDGSARLSGQQQFLRYNVAVLSSNFSLYGDISHRVMNTLETFGYPLEIYSIDEAFMEIPEDVGISFGQEVRARVLQWTGIPVSMGIGPTKTLAKVGSDLAKKSPSGVYLIDDPALALAKVPVEDIWGIGDRSESR